MAGDGVACSEAEEQQWNAEQDACPDQQGFERAAKEDPATATRLSEVQGLKEVYSHAVNGVKKEILDEVSMNVANPLNI